MGTVIETPRVVDMATGGTGRVELFEGELSRGRLFRFSEGILLAQ